MASTFRVALERLLRGETSVTPPKSIGIVSMPHLREVVRACTVEVLSPGTRGAHRRGSG
jgi:hypothetical protein